MVNNCYMKISLYIIVDNLFKFVLIFLFNLIWCTYFFNRPPQNLLTATACTLIIIILTSKLGLRKKKKQLLKLKEQQHVQDIVSTFIYMTQDELLNFFRKLASTKHNCEIKNGYIFINNNQKTIILYPLFKPSSFNKDDFVNIIKKIKDLTINKMVVVSNNFDGEIESEKNKFSFEIVLLNAKDMYVNLLKKYEFYPEIKPQNKPKAKIQLKTILTYSFNKKRTKSYLLSAICLFFASFFVLYKVYYIATSCVLVLFAIISYNSGHNNKVFELNPFE